MARPPRLILPGIGHHVTQRGNYRQKVFYREADRLLYLTMLKEYSRHYGIAVHAYCLMTNHVHLVVTPHNEAGLARLLQRLHSEYARSLHIRLRRVGHLWQARYQSVPMDEDHFWAAMVYVEQNPVRAGLVEDAGEWRWSSAGTHLSGQDDGLVDMVRWRSQHTPESWKRFLELGLADALKEQRIREATHYGWPLARRGFLIAWSRITEGGFVRASEVGAQA